MKPEGGQELKESVRSLSRILLVLNIAAVLWLVSCTCAVSHYLWRAFFLRMQATLDWHVEAWATNWVSVPPWLYVVLAVLLIAGLIAKERLRCPKYLPLGLNAMTSAACLWYAVFYTVINVMFLYSPIGKLASHIPG